MAGTFRVGDIVCGINEHYHAINHELKEAEVVSVYDPEFLMEIVIIDHIDKTLIGERVLVANSDINFKLKVQKKRVFKPKSLESLYATV